MKRYKPLIVLFLVSIVGALALLARSLTSSLDQIMVNFSAFFFFFLATLKFWDLKGFSKSFAQYDLIAKKNPIYGYAYPFLELLLSVGYFTQFFLGGVAIITALLMLVTLLGVVVALIEKKDLLCACMGTKLDLPLGVVTIAENLLMGIMAVFIFIHRL